MSRRHRRQSEKSLFTRVNSPALVAPDQTPSASIGAFPGAEWSRDRGFVYFHDLDSEREVDSWSRTELMRRNRAMYNGIGFVRGIVNGTARMVVGTGLNVQPTASDSNWNRRAQRVFAARTSSRQTFHLARKYSFAASQRAVMRGKLKDGDLLSVFARTETGALRVALYEGSQIGTGSQRTSGFVDGVRLDRHRGAIGYRILTRDEKGKEITADVDAMHCSLVADYERTGQARGLSCLYHAVNRLLDRGEILAATTKGIKLSAHLGYAIETAAGSPGPQTGNMAPKRPQTTVQLPNGKKLTLDQLVASGQIEELQPGQSIKILHDARPHPNVSAHLDGLVRDISIGTGFFPEVTWNVAGLGGANTRWVMASAQSRIEELQEILVETYCAPVYLAHIADAIEQGELDFHPEWFLHTWLTPARLTVDFGRDGKLHLEQYKQGHITLRTLYGYRGEDWKIEIDDYVDEVAYKRDRAELKGLTLAEVWPDVYGPKAGAAAPAQGGKPAKDDEEDPEEDPEDDTDPEDDE